MSFYGRSNRLLIEQELSKGELRESEIVECDLSGLRVEKAVWDHADMRDLHANDIEFKETQLKNSSFFRSNFMHSRFLFSSFTNMTLDGLTLIKSHWQNCVLTGTTLRNNCLQRARFQESRIISSAFLDFEALNVQIDNCVFAHSMFSISYGGGMNGFSSAEIKNCIFYNCRFEGFPLRGALVRSTAFVHCGGEIGDGMECDNVAGLGLRGRALLMPVNNGPEAERLFARFAS
jgi:uncharacterized protein YjbI with pentapeptide repeats